MIIQHSGWTSTFHCKCLCEIQMWLIYCSPIIILKSDHNKILHTWKLCCHDVNLQSLVASQVTTSTVYWCIASKLKVLLIFYGVNKTFLRVDLSLFNQSYSGGITTTKSLPDIGGTTIQDVGPLAAMVPGIHNMSYELILQNSCNIFLSFKWILVMKSGQNISHYTAAKLSVHVWNHDLIW